MNFLRLIRALLPRRRSMPQTFTTKNFFKDPAWRLWNTGTPPAAGGHTSPSDSLWDESDCWRITLAGSPSRTVNHVVASLTDADRRTIRDTSLLYAGRLTWSSGTAGMSVFVNQRIPIWSQLNFGAPNYYFATGWIYPSKLIQAQVVAILNYGTGGSPSAEETLIEGPLMTSSPDTWTKIGGGVPLKNFLAKTLGTNRDAYLKVGFRFPTTAESQSIRLTGWQIEQGQSPTAFSEEGPFYTPDFSADRLRVYNLAPSTDTDVIPYRFLTEDFASDYLFETTHSTTGTVDLTFAETFTKVINVFVDTASVTVDVPGTTVLGRFLRVINKSGGSITVTGHGTLSDNEYVTFDSYEGAWQKITSA